MAASELCFFCNRISGGQSRSRARRRKTCPAGGNDRGERRRALPMRAIAASSRSASKAYSSAKDARPLLARVSTIVLVLAAATTSGGMRKMTGTPSTISTCVGRQLAVAETGQIDPWSFVEGFRIGRPSHGSRATPLKAGDPPRLRVVLAKVDDELPGDRRGFRRERDRRPLERRVQEGTRND